MDLEHIKTQFLAQYMMSSEKTKNKYKKDLELFLEVCSINTTEDLNNFNNENIQKFYEYSQQKNWKPTTSNQRLEIAKIFTSWAFKKKYIENDFLDDVKKIRTVNNVHYVPTEEECNKLLEYIKTHKSSKRLYLMTKFLLTAGLRRSEVCNLKIEDLDKQNVSIRVLGKGKKVVDQPITNQFLIELIEYINTERREVIQKYVALGGKDKGYLFVSGIGEKVNKDKKDLTNGNKINDNVLYMQLKRYAKLAGLENFEKWTPHCLRRMAGTKIYNQTGDIKTAQEFLRHSSVATTEQCYVAYNRQKIVDAINSVEQKNAIVEQNVTRGTLSNSFTDDDEFALYLLLKKKFDKAE